MKRVFAFVASLSIAACVFGAEEKPGSVSLNEHEKKFQELLSGAELTGSFTITGKENGGAPKQEKYKIVKATKLDDRHWLIVASWGKAKLPIPLRLQVEWAGDTPMIQLTDFTIPGMGTFTSRVLFHESHYAGTWRHDNVGGHLFGVITPLKENDKADAE